MVDQVKVNIAANFVGKIFTTFLSLIFIPFYVKFLGIEAYGLVGIFAGLSAISGVLDLGLKTTANRELAILCCQEGKEKETRDFVRTFQTIYWGMAILIGLAVFSLAPLIAYHWLTPASITPKDAEQAIMIMGLAIALNWPFAFYSGGLLGLGRQVLLNGLVICAEGLRGIGTILVLWLISPSIQAFFCFQAAINVILTYSSARLLWGSLPHSTTSSKFDRKIFARISRFATGMSALSVMIVISSQLDKVILSRLLPLEIFGYFILASTIARPATFLVNGIYTAVFPRLSQLATQVDTDGISRLYHQSSQLVSVVLFPVVIVVALFSSEILLLWVGKSELVTHTYLLLSLLVVAYAFDAVMAMPVAAQLAYGWIKLLIFQNLFGLFILVPLMICLTELYGAIGAAIAWIIVNCGYCLLTIPIMHKKLLKGELCRWYRTDVGLPLACALCVGLIARLTMPPQTSAYAVLLWLLSISTLTLLVTIFATPFTRSWATTNISLVRRALGACLQPH